LAAFLRANPEQQQDTKHAGYKAGTAIRDKGKVMPVSGTKPKFPPMIKKDWIAK